MFVFVLILAMIQDQALVASKHFLVETENENLADNAVDSAVDLESENLLPEDGDDYRWGFSGFGPGPGPSRCGRGQHSSGGRCVPNF